MRKTTREKVLEIIRRRQSITTEELSNILGITVASVRHHLYMLQKEGVVEVVNQKKVNPGRPRNIYGLSDLVLGDGKEQLLSILLDDLIEGNDDEIKKKIRKLSARFVLSMERVEGNMKPRQILAFLDNMKTFHYFPQWQASVWGAQIIYTRCPYKKLIDKFPQLCTFDTYILEKYFNLDVKLVEKMNSSEKESRHCLFQLIESSK